MTAPFDAFGPGILIVTRTDVTPGTPVNIGYSQAFSFQFAGQIKELYGQNQLPLDAARGTVKVTGRVTAACLSGLAWNTTFFGQTFTSGGLQWNYQESHALTAGAFSTTLTNISTFDQDLGVQYASTGLPLVKVTSAPAVGQYSTTGTGASTVYAFNSSETGPLLVSYTSTVTSGQTLTINNTLLGTSPTFQLDYMTTRSGKALIVRLNQCQTASLNLPAKLEDFIMPELELHIFANAAGQLGKIIFPEVS